MQVSLEGKVALVTGASKGIGRAIAAGMAEAGASVMLSSRKLDQLEQAAAGDRRRRRRVRRQRRPASTPPTPAWRRRSSASAGSTSSSTTPPPTRTTARRSTSPPSMFDKTFEVNLRGPLYWSHAAYRQAFAAEPGVIVNIASVGGMRTEFGLGVYNLTKAALIHLTRQLANELGPDARGRHRARAGEDRLRQGARRQLRRVSSSAACRPGGSASRRTSPTWPCSSPPTRRRGSPARPT